MGILNKEMRPKRTSRITPTVTVTGLFMDISTSFMESAL